jgi:hypothetical protein
LDNSGTTALVDVEVELYVIDLDANNATGLFVISEPTIEGMTVVNSTTLNLAAESIGNLKWLMIPLPDAAPFHEVFYRFLLNFK